MRRIIFSNLSPSATRSLGATISIDRSDHAFLGQLWLEILDCAGQSGYGNDYLDGEEEENGGNNVFHDVAALVYVFDVESRGFGIPQKRKKKEKRRSRENGVNRQDLVNGRAETMPTIMGTHASTSALESDSDSGYSSDEYSTTDLFAGSSGEDLRTFALVVSRLKESCPEAHIFALVHKMDLVTYSLRESVFQERQFAIKRVVAHVTNYLLKRGKLGCHARHTYNPGNIDKTTIYPPSKSIPLSPSPSDPHPPTSPLTILPTSIWDPSLYAAWSTITSHLLPPSPFLTTYLHHLATSLPRFEEILVFEAATWLKVLGVTSEFGARNPEKGRGERVSAIVQSLRKGRGGGGEEGDGEGEEGGLNGFGGLGVRDRGWRDDERRFLERVKRRRLLLLLFFFYP